MTKKTLLPIGFEDWIAPQAGQAHRLLCQIIDCFQSYNYPLVAPPVMEFEESLLTAPDAPRAQDMFRLVDPISRRTIALRADITRQVTRLAEDHLTEQLRPLRLCYYGHVFRIAGSALRPHRQYMQLGIERIGVEDALDQSKHPHQGCTEVLRITLEALIEAGISDLCLDFALPVLLRDTVAGLSEEAQQLLAARNIGGLRAMVTNGALSESVGEILYFVLSLPPDPETALKNLHKSKYFTDKKAFFSQLSIVCDQLSQSHPQVLLSLDLVEQRHFGDKTGIAYNIYAAGLNAVVGRGGEYTANQEQATGVSLYLDSILALQPSLENAVEEKLLTVPLGTNFLLTRQWRKQGWQVQFSDRPPKNGTHYWDGQRIKKQK